MHQILIFLIDFGMGGIILQQSCINQVKTAIKYTKYAVQ